MTDDYPDYEYPASWAPPGETPPIRKSYEPALRSGLGLTGEEQPDGGYPPEWDKSGD